jgi:ankyrin repeat protein
VHGLACVLPLLYFRSSQEGFTPLMIATKRKHADIVEALGKSGAVDMNLRHKVHTWNWPDGLC